MGQNFHICLRSGPRGLTPTPSLIVSLTIKYPFFYAFTYYYYHYLFTLGQSQYSLLRQKVEVLEYAVRLDIEGAQLLIKKPEIINNTWKQKRKYEIQWKQRGKVNKQNMKRGMILLWCGY